MIRHLTAAVLVTALASAGASHAQQSVPASPPPPADSSTAPASAGQASQASAPASRTKSAAPATRREEQDTLEPAVDTSRTAAEESSAPATGAAGSEPRKSGKAMDHLELGTTDITGNRELPKVLYIVPWKHSDLGDLAGKPLNSLVDQTLQPIDREVFKRENRYYGAVAQRASGTGASPREPATGTSRGDARTAPPASGDER